MMATTSIRRNFVLFAAGALTLLGTFFFGVNFNWVRSNTVNYFTSDASNPSSLRFHLVLPATASNQQFCKLLLSAGLNGYPEPVFLGWEGRGMWNGTQSHLFKISETLAYLRSLPPASDNDLVLLLDAYDVWLQMPPDVLIKRYFKLIDNLNSRLKEEGIYNMEVPGGARIRNSVVFGADKICWPQPFRMPACWAVPNSTMDPHVFGPDTDSNMFKNRPRWLNSGTIMGPVKDMRDVMSAGMDMISRRFDEGFNNHNSDQYYFAEVLGEQEQRRLLHRDGEIRKLREDSMLYNITDDRRAEFHVALDYNTDLFMAGAAYDRAISWMRFNHSTAATTQDRGRQSQRMSEWTLPPELLAAPGPFTAAPHAFDDLPRHLSWPDVMLGTNTITGDPFPILHMTGDKSFRDRWWPRMWFHPHGEALLRAKKMDRAAQRDPDVFAVVDGITWKAVRPSTGSFDYAAMHQQYKKGGAWSDRGEFLPWESLCGIYENKGFYRTD